jgi:hypothetical protein
MPLKDKLVFRNRIEPVNEIRIGDDVIPNVERKQHRLGGRSPTIYLCAGRCKDRRIKVRVVDDIVK